MVCFKLTCLPFRILLIWAVLLPAALQAQDQKRYQGPMRIGPYQGVADYTYKVVEGDTLLDGPFLLERSSLDELLETRDTTFSFSGAFKDHYPDDFWRFEFGEFESERESRVVNYQYRVAISGVQELASGLIREGRPTGSWDYTIQKIENSELSGTLFNSRFEFDQGVPQGSFRIENEAGTLVGRFLKDGFAHDEWALFYTNEIGASEQWNFLEGILQNIQITSEGETRIWEFFGNRVPNEKVLNLDARYLKALALYLPATDSTRLEDLGIFMALEKNASLYAKLDAILSELGRSEFKPSFKVKLPHFPLDSLEREQLDTLAVQVEKARAISEELLNDTQLNLLKLSDEQAMYLYGSVRALSRTFLDPLQIIVSNYREGVLEFIPRDEYILHFWPQERPSPTVAVSMGEAELVFRDFSGPGADSLDFSSNGLLAVSQMGDYVYESLDSIQNSLGDKLNQSRRQQELISLEEQMIPQDLRLNKLLDSLEQVSDKSVQKALINIRATADGELSRYATMEDAAAKLDKARELTACLEDLEKLALAVSPLPEQEAQVKEAYQDAVWNPFMAVIMNEEVKKRITGAYRKTLIPYFLQTVETELSCANAGALAKIIPQAHERILELREEDTSRLERKLRREKDPLAVLELFGLDIQNLNPQ